MSKKKEKEELLGDVKKFVVKRKRWMRGNMKNSALLTQNGKMCCLGFYARACGLAPKQIKGKLCPSDVANEYNFDSDDVSYKKVWSTKLVNRSRGDSQTCMKMMAINDAENLTDEEREVKLKALFKKVNINVKFED